VLCTPANYFIETSADIKSCGRFKQTIKRSVCVIFAVILHCREQHHPLQTLSDWPVHCTHVIKSHEERDKGQSLNLRSSEIDEEFGVESWSTASCLRGLQQQRLHYQRDKLSNHTLGSLLVQLHRKH